MARHEKSQSDRPAPTTVRKALGTGVRELPRNASWVLAKALTPFGSAGKKVGADSAGAASGLRTGAVDAARAAGVGVKDAWPGRDDSVELRLKRAHAAADAAKEAEERSVASARRADALTREAAGAERANAERIEKVRTQQEAEADKRVREAQADAQRRVAEVRAEEQARVGPAVERATAEADADAEKKRRRAQEAQAEAEKEFAEATERLAEARRLSDEATQAAQEAAAQAQQEADRLRGAARSQSTEARKSVAAARRTQQRASSAADKKVAEVKKRPGPGSQSRKLSSLTKKELIDLATAKGVDGRSSMTKDQLVRALR